MVCAAARPKLTVAKLPQSLMMVAWPGHGLRMGFIWDLYGFKWDLYGFIWDLYGIMWDLYGIICMDMDLIWI